MFRLKIAEVNSLCGQLATCAALQGAELSVRDLIYLHLRLGVLSYVMCTNEASVRINMLSVLHFNLTYINLVALTL